MLRAHFDPVRERCGAEALGLGPVISAAGFQGAIAQETGDQAGARGGNCGGEAEEPPSHGELAEPFEAIAKQARIELPEKAGAAEVLVNEALEPIGVGGFPGLQGGG